MQNLTPGTPYALDDDHGFFLATVTITESGHPRLIYHMSGSMWPELVFAHGDRVTVTGAPGTWQLDRDADSCWTLIPVDGSAA